MLIIAISALAIAPPPPTYPNLTDLFHQLDPRLPRGDYRIPSLVTSLNGTLLAFIAGRFHRTDITPNNIYLRRSLDAGKTWLPAQTVLTDPHNGTEYSGAPVVDPATGTIHYIFTANVFGHACSGCAQHIMSTTDDGATWSVPKPLTLASGPANSTWGTSLASGIALTRGAYAGRLMVALRHDCGCGTLRASFVVYSDDHGKSWTGGAEMLLLPKYGGGWTEAQVAELKNGSVLMTSRNFYGRSSGQGPRLFARSDDGGATWAANWSAGSDLPGPYCEASILGAPSQGKLYVVGPSGPGRGNLSVHISSDGGLTWPVSHVLYPKGAAYSDASWTTAGGEGDKEAPALAFFFERDNYNTAAFGKLPGV